jgi:hypothetical protein
MNDIESYKNLTFVYLQQRKKTPQTQNISEGYLKPAVAQWHIETKVSNK